MRPGATCLILCFSLLFFVNLLVSINKVLNSFFPKQPPAFHLLQKSRVYKPLPVIHLQTFFVALIIGTNLFVHFSFLPFIPKTWSGFAFQSLVCVHLQYLFSVLQPLPSAFRIPCLKYASKPTHTVTSPSLRNLFSLSKNYIAAGIYVISDLHVTVLLLNGINNDKTEKMRVLFYLTLILLMWRIW